MVLGRVPCICPRLTEMPSFANLPTIRGEPQVGFIDDVVRISAFTSPPAIF